jgi:bile acid-coenzyme A ligase
MAPPPPTGQEGLSPQPVSFGRRLSALAEERGEETAVVFAAANGTEEPLSWSTLDRRANQMAHRLADENVMPGDVVVVGLGNSLEHLFCTFGAWKLGASVLPLRSELPAWERGRVLDVASAQVVIGDWQGAAPGTISLADVRATTALKDAAPEEDHAPPHSRLLATSGSTGTPKIIVTPARGVYQGDAGGSSALVAPGARVLVTSPLYHTNGFAFCYPVLLTGSPIVLMERFDAARAVDLIESHHVQMTVLVPTMLQRIARLEGIKARDLSSLERVVYGGASLPEWVARTWLELIAPERFLFVYGGSEGLGLAMCSGREWLEHPGTTGRPLDCDTVILDAEAQVLGPGEVGEIWMRLHSDDEPFRYVGIDTPAPQFGGYRTFGDMGWLDDDGYLYIADRRQDMIVTGGVNVFPAEVEAVLTEHPAVDDVVVIGLPDPEWGHRVHAIVQPSDATLPPSIEELRAHCKARVSGPKVPKTFEVVARLPRTAAGKINRSRLVDERFERP